MSKLAIRNFEYGLRKIGKPELELHGLKFDGRRKFLTIKSGISFGVEFQLGHRSLENKFTINLFAGDMYVRIGMIQDNWQSKLVNHLGIQRTSLIYRLLSPRDKWWQIDSWDATTSEAIIDACKMIQKHGLPWINAEINKRNELNRFRPNLMPAAPATNIE